MNCYQMRFGNLLVTVMSESEDKAVKRGQEVAIKYHKSASIIIEDNPQPKFIITLLAEGHVTGFWV